MWVTGDWEPWEWPETGGHRFGVNLGWALESDDGCNVLMWIYRSGRGAKIWVVHRKLNEKYLRGYRFQVADRANCSHGCVRRRQGQPRTADDVAHHMHTLCSRLNIHVIRDRCRKHTHSQDFESVLLMGTRNALHFGLEKSSAFLRSNFRSAHSTAQL